MPQESVQARILTRLEECPRARAIAFYEPSRSFAWRSREQFFAEGAAVAGRLAEAGLRPGDVCAIVMTSGDLAARTLLGTLLHGSLPLLVAPPLLQGANSDLPRILRRTVERTGSPVVAGDAGMTSLRDELEAELPGTRFLLGEEDLAGETPPGFAPATPRADDLFALQLTSGTTGFPRICVWKQGPVLAALDGMSRAMAVGSDDVYLNWTPLYHDMGLVNNFLLCVALGVPLVLLGPQDFMRRPALWLQGLSDTGANTTWSPNFGFAVCTQRVREAELAGVRLDHVKGFWNAAERIHYATMVDFHRRFSGLGVRWESLKTNFGCAENVGGATFSDPRGAFVVEHVDRRALQEDWEARPLAGEVEEGRSVAVVGVGRMHPLARARILGEDSDRLPDGKVGELALETPSRMVGYLDDEAATREAIAGPLLRTGDLAYLRDGEIFWVGRVRERINSRGKKIDPSDLEPVLFQVDGLRPGCFAAFGVDDELQGTQRVVVVSEVREPLVRAPEEISAEIRSQAFARLGVAVSEVLLVPAGVLTKTSSGKRRHRHARDLYLRGELTGAVVGVRGAAQGA